MAYAVVYGMNIAVEKGIVHKGDTKIPAGGVIFAPSSVGVSIKSHMPGMFDFTYGMAASILRGIWELTAYYGSYTLVVDIYLGSIIPATYARRANVYIKVGDSNMTVDGLAPTDSSDATLLSA